MKRILWIALAVVLAAAGNVQAEGDHHGKEKWSKMDMEKVMSEKIEKMTAELALTSEQQQQVKQIMQEKIERKRQIMEEKRAAMDALQEDVQAKMKAALTEEQLKKWEEFKKDKSGMMGKCPHCEEEKKCSSCKIMKEKGMGMGRGMEAGYEMEMEKGMEAEKGAEK